jgi:prepilin-type processing-associated H-X9-DG protein
MRSAALRATCRRALSAGDLLWLLFFLLLLLLVLLPALSRGRQKAKEAVCSANLRGLGQGMHIYANDNMEWFPHHYFEPTYDEQDPTQHGVRWVGTMGTNDFLSITEPTSSTTSPTRSHPSRSLFLLVIGGYATPVMFVCPQSTDQEDGLRNYGPDAVRTGGPSEPAVPGRSRYDFRGYPFLSYGYQMPYGRRGRPSETLDSRMVIAADKGPYYAAGGEGVSGTRTVRDRRSDVTAPADWAELDATQILEKPPGEWRRYNSRNHQSEGQNVLFVDGHVSFEGRPIVGVHGDNVYTVQTGYDPVSVLIGSVPGPDETLGPLTQTDSFLVP